MPALEWIGYLSTVGVYGDHGGAWVDERPPAARCQTLSVMRARRQSRRGRRWARRSAGPWRSCRLPGIYGPGRNGLRHLEKGKARRLVKSGQVFNRIHFDDIAMRSGIDDRREYRRIFNLTDDDPAPPQDVVTYAAALMGVKPPPEIPFDTAQLSPMARLLWRE